MGNSASTQDNLISTFAKEIAVCDNMITSVMEDRRSVIDSKDRCMNDFNLLLKADLNRHLKLDIKSLKDTVYFVPNSQALHSKTAAFVTKDDLCNEISTHYGRIVKMVGVMQSVYSTGTKGVHSFLDRVLSSVVEVDGQGCPRTIRICRELTGGTDLMDEVGGLRGFHDMLSPTEKGIFSDHLNRLFSNPSDASNLRDAAVCGDVLFSHFDYRDVFPKETSKARALAASAPACQLYREKTHLFPTELAQRPASRVLPFAHSASCAKVRELKVNTDKQKEAKRILSEMKRRMAVNLRKMKAVLSEIVQPAGQAYQLRHLTAVQLDAIETKAKKIVAAYYLSSLSSFNELCDCCSMKKK
jgi:hypothetical protein